MSENRRQDCNMEEMLEVMKKQLKMQKLISGLLAVMLVFCLLRVDFLSTG